MTTIEDLDREEAMEKEKMPGIQLMCSLSHDAGVAVGVVIANKVDIP